MSLLHQIALSCLPGIGSVLSRTLLSYCGNAEEVFNSRIGQLTKIPGIGPKTIEQIVNHSVFSRAEEELEFIEKFKITPLFIDSDQYPKRLKNCSDAPVMLYFKGDADLNSSKVISIVGTRNASDYGREICRSLISDLKTYNPLIISGLAYGIDSAAHREALKNSIPTIGVLAHGLDRIYPAQHRNMAEKMLESGGLITEFMSGTIPDRENFPKRNRIIAGMSDLTIVVEANIKGGALITAELANAYNRDVFAFPGRITDECSRGCNHLIKTNRANLITGIADIEYIMGWNRESPKPLQKQLSLLVDLNDEERRIADIIKEYGEITIDNLALLSSLQQSRLAVNILEMEMKGIVISMPGKVYKLA